MVTSSIALREMNELSSDGARLGRRMIAVVIVLSSLLTSMEASTHEARHCLEGSRGLTDEDLINAYRTGAMPHGIAQAIDFVQQIMQPGLNQSEVLSIVVGAAIIFFLGLVLQLCRRYHRRTLATVQLQAELTRAQLQAMKAQLHPHFLFNTLNTISVLVTENPAKANRMIILLSDLLRQSLDISQEDEVTLRRELELLHEYLEIQRMRFRRRLSVSYDISDSVLDAKVPTFTLQPIVENAIRHGIAQQRKGGRIDIRASRIRGSLMLQVQDDGPGLSMDKMRQRNGSGIGLVNTSKRLSCIYGSASTFTIESRKPNGTVATIVIPFHTNGSPS
jgi:two-component system, LytTR family, sensor kinase